MCRTFWKSAQTFLGYFQSHRRHCENPPKQGSLGVPRGGGARALAACSGPAPRPFPLTSTRPALPGAASAPPAAGGAQPQQAVPGPGAGLQLQRAVPAAPFRPGTVSRSLNEVGAVARGSVCFCVLFSALRNP